MNGPIVRPAAFALKDLVDLIRGQPIARSNSWASSRESSTFAWSLATSLLLGIQNLALDEPVHKGGDGRRVPCRVSLVWSGIPIRSTVDPTISSQFTQLITNARGNLQAGRRHVAILTIERRD